MEQSRFERPTRNVQTLRSIESGLDKITIECLSITELFHHCKIVNYTERKEEDVKEELSITNAQCLVTQFASDYSMLFSGFRIINFGVNRSQLISLSMRISFEL